MFKLKLFIEGTKKNIYYVKNPNSKKDMLKDFERSNGTEYKKFKHIADRLAKEGSIKNASRYKELYDGVFEFKPDSYRAFSFHGVVLGDNSVVITHLRTKPPSNQAYDNEVRKAIGIKGQVIELLKKKDISSIIYKKK